MENEWGNFVEYWNGRGDKKGESQPFWLNLIRLLGIADSEKLISFENRVSLSHASFIDAYIPLTKVLIEQKKIDKDFRNGPKNELIEKIKYEQWNGELLAAIGQPAPVAAPPAAH